MMDKEEQVSQLPTKSSLFKITATSLVVAGVLLVGFVLPAEYGVDPLGLGRLTGVGKIGEVAPEPVVVATPVGQGAPMHSYDAPYRTDTIDIPLAEAGAPGYQLEYKVSMKQNESIVYSWSTSDVENPAELHSDFHAESSDGQGMEYLVKDVTQSHGALVAPMNGIHGWYFKNSSKKPIVIRLKISGFYELIPAGENGNRKGLLPVKAN